MSAGEKSSTHGVPQTLSQAEDHAWVDHAARLGFVAYGVVHLVIAFLALQLAFGDRSGKASSSGAMQQIAEQPFGLVALWLVAVGMLLLVLWRALEVVAGHREHEGSDRLKKRLASGLKAGIYAVIGVSAVRVALGGGSGGGTDGPTARVMNNVPGGQALIGLIGVGVLAYAGAQIYQGWSESFLKNLDAEGRSGEVGRLYKWTGKVGYVAKGISLAIVGGLFAYAAITHNATKSGGLDQALLQILEQPYGTAMLTVVALGIGCYGVFCFVRARHLSR